MKIIYFIMIVVLAGCASLSHKDEEVIYRKKNTSLLDVFNLTKLHFSSEPINYLKNRNFKYGEFGGLIMDCSNEEYYCLIGGIGAVIPKKFTGQKEWELQNNKCHSENPLTLEQTAIITCSSKGWSNRFVYSTAKGITSYTYEAEPQIEYELVDEKGLFTQPADNTVIHEATHKVN